MANTASSVRLGWWERDSRKVLSWRCGLKGSAGHCAASLCSWVPTALVVIAQVAGVGRSAEFQVARNGAWRAGSRGTIPAVHFGIPFRHLIPDMDGMEKNPSGRNPDHLSSRKIYPWVLGGHATDTRVLVVCERGLISVEPIQKGQ